MVAELEAEIDEELREELGDDIANLALKQQILEGNKKLQKKKKKQATGKKRVKQSAHRTSSDEEIPSTTPFPNLANITLGDILLDIFQFKVENGLMPGF